MDLYNKSIESELSYKLKGVFLILLVIFANFLAQLFPCSLQKLFNDNIFAKHILILLLIFYTIHINDDINHHPAEILFYSVLIYFIFLLFSKQNLVFAIIALILLVAKYINYSFIQYYDNLTKPKKHNLNNINEYINILLLLVLLLGFFKYFIKQRKDHKKNWSFLKFLFGNVRCINK